MHIEPYIRHFSGQISSIVSKKFQLKPLYNYPFKLNRIIKLQKDKLKTMNNTDSVYKINCKKCEKCYIGQNGRLISTRCDEHMKNKRYNKKYHNVNTKYILENSEVSAQHDMDWENVEVLYKEYNWK